tara:strand:- start:73884 stop:75533 length:1650 start_codon:yes stop_codon:yes gene_type:complete
MIAKSLRISNSLGPALALALLFSFATVACKGKKNDDADTSGAKVTQAPAAREHGGNVKLPSNEPRFLNPVLETRFNRANILLFEGLVGFDGTLEPVPRLAESWEQSNEGKTITFRLRKGVKWSDGTDFTSKDVAFTVEQIRNPKWRTLWRTYFSGIESVNTPDDLTVVVNYKTPYAPALVSWSVGILPAHKFVDTDFTTAPANMEPVGTGPFKLTRWEQGGRMLLARNDKWWNGKAGLGTIELVFGLEDKLAALKAGKIDFANIPDIGRWASEAQLPDFLDRFEQTTSVESIFRLIAWNGAKAPFDKPEVRQALTHALDRERVIDDVLLGEGQLLSAPFFANMYGADSRIAPYAFDLKIADEQLTAAGFPKVDGKRFELDLITLTSQKLPIHAEMFAIFQHDLASLGIALKVSYLTPVEFEERHVAGNFDAAFFGWLRDIPDPDPSALLHSSQIQGGQNFARYTNEDVDGWLEAAVSTSDRDQRKVLYAKVHGQLHKDMPYTVLYAPHSHYAWSRKLRRTHPADVSAQTRFPGISRWTVDAATSANKQQ